MKTILVISLTASLLISLPYSQTLSADNTEDLEQRAGQSRIAVKEFMQQLKGELMSSMKASGPVNTISMCKETAPVIAKNLSAKYNWKIARTSLKTRNSANAADAWETTVLKEFETRKKAGEDVKTMDYFAVVEDGGKQTFRYMKAIPTGEPCLACHGENISADVIKKLDMDYPADTARGFKAGDIRGAFTISQALIQAK